MPRFLLSGLAATALFFLSYDPIVQTHPAFSHSIQVSTFKFARGIPVSSLIIMTNTPQLLITLGCLEFNRLITSMAAAREWSLFAHQRKGLRTSTPRGAQRSTYWLHLPLKLSVPMMLASAGLHYLMSQSLFFGFIRHYDYRNDEHTGERLVLKEYSGLGYSQTAVHVLMIALVLLMGAAVLMGKGHNSAGIPPLGCCSAVISAACHPPAEEVGAHLKPVQWGEVSQQASDGNTSVRHCSFSSEEVTMPVEGKELAFLLR